MKSKDEKQKRAMKFARRRQLLRFALILTLAIPFNLFAQKALVNGVVAYSDNEPIIGAKVAVKGSTVATVTNFDGRFSIEASPNDVLVVRYVGMLTKEVAV